MFSAVLVGARPFFSQPRIGSIMAKASVSGASRRGRNAAAKAARLSKSKGKVSAKFLGKRATSSAKRRAPAAASRDPDLLRAHVMLAPERATKSSSENAECAGRSLFIPAAASAAVVDQVRDALAGHGFRIVGVSPAAITIEASPKLYQKVFGKAVRPYQQQARAKGLKGQFPKKTWRFQGKPQIPADLRSRVGEVVFPASAAIHV